MQGPVSPSWRRTLTPVALAVISLLSATALWVAVTDAENPRRVRQFGAAILIEPVNVPQGFAVASFSQQAVSIRVNASDDTFNQLTTADFAARVDLTGVTGSSVNSVVQVRTVDRDDVEIVDVTPAFVDVTLEPETTKQVPVQVNRNGSPPQGYVVTTVEANPNTVRVRGAASRLQQIESAAVDVNLTGLRISLERQYRLTPRDARGADITNITLEPSSAQVNVSVQQQAISVPLPVQPQVRGSVADGYHLTGVSMDPQVVSLDGPLELVQAIPVLSTEPIDISGLSSDLTRSVRLQLPAGVTSSRNTVNVTFRVEPAVGERVFAVAPTVENVPGGLRASLQTTSVDVRITGQEPTLNRLLPGSVRVRVNASGLSEGVHVVNAEVGLPEGVSLVSFDPAQVIVVLRP